MRKAAAASVLLARQSTASTCSPSDACTVTVGGEKKHGRMAGTSWCCLNKGTTREHCYNCADYVCRSGWHVVDVRDDAPQFESL